MFQRLHELFEATEAFFGIMDLYFPLQGKKNVCTILMMGMRFAFSRMLRSCIN